MRSDISAMNQLTQTWKKRLRLNRICQFNVFSLPFIIDWYDKFLTGLDVLMSFCWAPFQQIVSWSAYSIPLPRTKVVTLYYINRRKNQDEYIGNPYIWSFWQYDSVLFIIYISPCDPQSLHANFLKVLHA